MRRTILLSAPATLVLISMALAPPATADDQIPVTCETVSEVQGGWDTNGKSLSVTYLGDNKGVPSETGDYLWHFGTGNFGAHGDEYCRGFWYFDAGWYLTPPPLAWPPMQGEGRLWGTVDMKLRHAGIDGGWSFTYEGQWVWDVASNMVWTGSGSGYGYGALQGWEIALDVSLPYYPPVAMPAANPGSHEVWTGYVTPTAG